MASGKRRFLIVVGVFFIAIVFWLAIFPLRTPRVFLNQRRAAESLRILNLAQRDYAMRHENTGFACNLSDLGERGPGPASSVRVDPVLASGTKSWYRFEIRCREADSGKATAYQITAVPTEPGTTGVYALCTDQSGEIWYSENGVASDCLKEHKALDQKYR